MVNSIIPAKNVTFHIPSHYSHFPEKKLHPSSDYVYQSLNVKSIIIITLWHYHTLKVIKKFCRYFLLYPQLLGYYQKSNFSNPRDTM
jgi:hypothetical protein